MEHREEEEEGRSHKGDERSQREMERKEQTTVAGKGGREGGGEGEREREV